jgi:rsbT antagonist protein RsbS
MDRIPILRMGPFLLVSIQVDMHDRLALALQDDLMNKIRATSARGVLIDISALDLVDSFIGRMIGNIAAMAHILDAETVVTGMRPAVAITLVRGAGGRQWSSREVTSSRSTPTRTWCGRARRCGSGR